MPSHRSHRTWGTSREFADRVLDTIERFIHVEAVSGGVLIVAAILALLWANSSYQDTYDALWHTELGLSIGQYRINQSLHFIVNDVLMTIFFLVAGLEIRRELHEGILSNVKQAALPLVAAFGGVAVPAAIYLGMNHGTDLGRGWAIPIATDIAFAIGVLALLGKSIPTEVRTFLLALAIADDIVAVIVIAVAYSQGINMDSLMLVALAVLLILLFHRFAVRTPLAYLIPGALMWFGLWRLGVHPTLAGVILGLLTPVTPLVDNPVASGAARRELHDKARGEVDDEELLQSLKRIEAARRDYIPPVVAVQTYLHPWVAYAIMPLFAFANAGVSLSGLNGMDGASHAMAFGIGFGLLLGKPAGILLASVAAIRIGWCTLPETIGWRGLLLVACLGGIGFTMSIFIATLAFDSTSVLAVAKLTIVLASAAAAIVGLVMGHLLFRR